MNEDDPSHKGRFSAAPETSPTRTPVRKVSDLRSLRILRTAVALKRKVRSLSAGKSGRLENLFMPEGRFCIWLLLGYRSRSGVGGPIVHVHNKNLVSCVCLNSIPPEMPARRSHHYRRMLRKVDC
jgi:hypothetical protein